MENQLVCMVKFNEDLMLWMKRVKRILIPLLKSIFMKSFMRVLVNEKKLNFSKLNGIFLFVEQNKLKTSSRQV